MFGWEIRKLIFDNTSLSRGLGYYLFEYIQDIPSSAVKNILIFHEWVVQLKMLIFYLLTGAYVLIRMNITIHYECPCIEISLYYMDRLMMDCFSLTFLNIKVNKT